MLPHEQQEQRICGNQKPCLTQHTVTSPPRTGKGQARVRPGGRSFGHIAGANRNQAPDRLSHSGKPAAQIVGFNAGNAFPESQIVAAYMWGNYNNVAGNLPCRVFSAATRSEIHAVRNGYNEPGRMQELS